MGCFKIDGFSVKSFNHCSYAAHYEFWEYLLSVVFLQFPNSKTFLIRGTREESCQNMSLSEYRRAAGLSYGGAPFKLVAKCHIILACANKA